eukprot:8225797-Alexandrium_andersonii.AAC.1
MHWPPRLSVLKAREPGCARGPCPRQLRIAGRTEAACSCDDPAGLAWATCRCARVRCARWERKGQQTSTRA